MTRFSMLALVALAACRSADDGVDAPPPQPGVDVQLVTAVVTLDPETLALDATATLDVVHPDTLQRLVLGLDDAIEVVTVTVDGRAALFWRDGDALDVPLPVPASASPDSLRQSTVVIAYRGTPRAGIYAEEAAGQRVVFTDGWPDRTAGWLPDVHHPSDPSRLDLTVVVPEAFDVVASGAAVSDSVAAGRRHARFVLDQDAPPYTFAFAAADFSFSEQDGPVPVRHALLAGDAALAGRLSRTPRAIEVLQDALGPYPYATYATVEVPIAYAGMENAAAPFLRASLYHEDVEGRNAIEEVDFHELVHQWWGNAVVPADWRDLWLAEGAATYFTVEAYRRLDGWDAGRRHLVLMSRQISPEDAARSLVPEALDDPSDALTATVYQKGGAVFHLLRLTLGDAVFFEALQRIQTAYADRPLSTGAFREALEAVSGRDLRPLFDRWVTGEGIPTLQVRWDGPTKTLAWSVEGDDGTLDGVPFELYVRQGRQSWFVPAEDGVFSPPGDGRPEVEPVGLLLTVERAR